MMVMVIMVETETETENKIGTEYRIFILFYIKQGSRMK